jgi:hypothetical protein
MQTAAIVDLAVDQDPDHRPLSTKLADLPPKVDPVEIAPPDPTRAILNTTRVSRAGEVGSGPARTKMTVMRLSTTLRPIAKNLTWPA